MKQSPTFPFVASIHVTEPLSPETKSAIETLARTAADAMRNANRDVEARVRRELDAKIERLVQLSRGLADDMAALKMDPMVSHAALQVCERTRVLRILFDQRVPKG
jgi:TRAP-type C4-dicarboxylate transport system substrate-binding protein